MTGSKGFLVIKDTKSDFLTEDIPKRNYCAYGLYQMSIDFNEICQLSYCHIDFSLDPTLMLNFWSRIAIFLDGD